MTEDDANERDTVTPGTVQEPATLPPPLSQTSRGRPVVDLSFGGIGGSTTAPPGMFSFAPPQAPSTPGAIGGPPSLFHRIVELTLHCSSPFSIAHRAYKHSGEEERRVKI